MGAWRWRGQDGGEGGWEYILRSLLGDIVRSLLGDIVRSLSGDLVRSLSGHLA